MNKIYHYILGFVSVFALLFTLTSCGSGIAHGYVESVAERDLTPLVEDDNYQTFIDGNCDLAFDLYHELAKEDGNIALSPYSISQVLAMCWEGARGETESQIRNPVMPHRAIVSFSLTCQ